MTERGALRRGASLDLDGSMSRLEIADALDRMVFTAARDWRRTVRMDRHARDAIVDCIRRASGLIASKGTD